MREATIKCDGYSFFVIKQIGVSEQEFDKHIKELQEVADKGETPILDKTKVDVIWVRQDTV